MKKFRFIFFIFFLIILYSEAGAQTGISIPGFTAYALPAENLNEKGESTIFSRLEGVQHWTDLDQKICFYFRIRNKGTLNLALQLNPGGSGNKLSASIAGRDYILIVPSFRNNYNLQIGSISITDTGYYTLHLSCLSRKTTDIASIQSLVLSGDAAKNVQFNSDERRNAASVHLLYPLADSIKVLSFYTELTVPKEADPLFSYYMACGFARGYFGIQVNSPSERRVIFSVWDAGRETIDRNKVAEENKVKLVAKGENVLAEGFGNEGTGGHSHWIYDWKAGETYKFLVTAAIDSLTSSTIYAGYFLIPETHQWKLIACFKVPKDGKPLRNLYSFVENFEGSNGQLYRKAWFGNQWVRRDNGEWIELTESTFSFDATGKAGNRIDQGGGADSGKFYLWNGGFNSVGPPFGERFHRYAGNQKPVIDLYSNADSTDQALKDNREILDAIRSGKWDTTGSSKGIYYKILREGNGRQVELNDTVTVNYKGSLMNGEIFDSTKEKPAVFPLKRLIKGWQTGLPFCRLGGSIRLIIPSALAYTTRNLGIIPPNSVLVFDVDVLESRSGKQ